MKFGEERVDDAEGLILAHSLRLPAAMLKKGRVLTAADVTMLRAAGINFVTGARLEAGDLGENAAAELLGAALAGSGVRCNQPFSGRCTLLAATPGVVAIDRDRLDRLNSVDEAVTVSTVPPYEVVAPRQILATVKIIPFGVDRRVIEACAAFATMGGPLIAVHPFRPLKAALVLTTLPGLKPATLTAAAAATRARIAALGGTVAWEWQCPHEVGAVERTIARALAAGAGLVLIAGASATVDRRDVVPAAIVKAGGAIDHFGMPVDPGNLLLLAHIGTAPVVNLPGCGRSPKPNGLDWVLRRLAAGLPVRPADIMRMGAGGLLKEVHPVDERILQPREPRVAAVVLAAGRSARMGGNKMLAELGGKPLVARAVEAALGAGLAPVVVVTGWQADEVEEALPACDVLAVRNPDFAEGMAGSLARGLAALPADVDAALIQLADMPRVTSGHLLRLKAAFDPDEGRAICVPTFGGRRGNPVLFAREFFGEMESLSGDTGARRLLADHAERVCEVAMDDDSVLADIDTPADLEAERGRE